MSQAMSTLILIFVTLPIQSRTKLSDLSSACSFHTKYRNVNKNRRTSKTTNWDLAKTSLITISMQASYHGWHWRRVETTMQINGKKSLLSSLIALPRCLYGTDVASFGLQSLSVYRSICQTNMCFVSSRGLGEDLNLFSKAFQRKKEMQSWVGRSDEASSAKP